jgi:hypothetical protein
VLLHLAGSLKRSHFQFRNINTYDVKGMDRLGAAARKGAKDDTTLRRGGRKVAFSPDLITLRQKRPPHWAASHLQWRYASQVPARRRWIARVGALTPSAPCLICALGTRVFGKKRPRRSGANGCSVHCGKRVLGFPQVGELRERELVPQRKSPAGRRGWLTADCGARGINRPTHSRSSAKASELGRRCALFTTLVNKTFDERTSDNCQAHML